MKKKLLKILLCLSLVALFIAPFTISSTVKADIGFDGGYDGGYSGGGGYGGGYGGGSSWDDDDDDDYYYSGGYNNNNNYSSGSGGNLSTAEIVALIIFCVASIGIPIAITMIGATREKRVQMDAPAVNVSWMRVDEDLNMEVYLLYKAINDAWMKKDLEPVRHLLTDEMYNMYLMQLDTLIENKQTNIMKDYWFISGHISNRRKYKGKEIVDMIFRIKCKDYIIDDKTGKVVRGKATDVIEYTYDLRLIRNAIPKTITCPSCGGEVKGKDGVVCPNCQTIIHLHTDTFRLADKRVIRQLRFRR